MEEKEILKNGKFQARVEALASTINLVKVEYLVAGYDEVVEGFVKNVYNKHGVDYLLLSGGKEIEIEKIKSVDSSKSTLINQSLEE